MNYIETDYKFIANTYKRQNVVLAEGKGATGFDTDGKKYIDFSSGIGVNSMGFCNDLWLEAVTKQLNKLQHISNLYHTMPQIELAEKLCTLSGYQRVFFTNSGTESTETAIKIARKYSFDKYGKDRNKILSLKNSFHGRTMAALTATGQELYHNYFFPFIEGFDYADATDIKGTLQTLQSSQYAAVMIEVVQGEGGLNSIDHEFIVQISKYCQENDILFVVDEVQTGIGRTGTLLAQEQFDVKADIVMLAKGLGGGLPIGAVLMGEKTKDVFQFGDHGATYGGNPVACAGAITVLDNLDLDEVKRKSTYMREKLSKLDEVKSLSGLGLMVGIELKSKEATEVLESCLDKGLLVLTAKTKVRLLPPLNISQEELDCGLEILIEALSK